jgi:hypothetical protein
MNTNIIPLKPAFVTLAVHQLKLYQLTLACEKLDLLPQVPYRVAYHTFTGLAP